MGESIYAYGCTVCGMIHLREDQRDPDGIPCPFCRVVGEVRFLGEIAWAPADTP